MKFQSQLFRNALMNELIQSNDIKRFAIDALDYEVSARLLNHFPKYLGTMIIYSYSTSIKNLI